MKFNLQTHPKCLVIQPEGRLDFDAAPEFQNEIEGVIDQASAQKLGLVIDCSQLSYISSAGLRTFLVAARSAKTRGVTLVACGLIPAVKEVFDLSGFSKLITLSANIDEAQARL